MLPPCWHDPEDKYLPCSQVKHEEAVHLVQNGNDEQSWTTHAFEDIV
jgi:hypothetical protein